MSESEDVAETIERQMTASQPADARDSAKAPTLPASTAHAPGWIRRRARNVYRRPLLVSAVGLTVFVAVLVAAVVAPLRERRAVRATLPPARTRPDTVAILHHIGMAGSVLRTSDSALLVARQSNAQASSAGDTAARADSRRDSVQDAVDELTSLLRRAHDAPLAASYRALGSARALRGDRRAGALLDTLSRLESSRAAFGATGSADPVFIALTTRLTQVGKQLVQAGDSKRTALLAESRRLGPIQAPVRVSDTMALERTHDSASAALASAHRWLAEARDVDHDMDASDARAKSADAVGASVPAMLAGAGALGVVVGFAVALALEVRDPRVSDVDEAESVASVRVLASVGEAAAAPVRRRRADQEMPPLVELYSEAYRLLFAQLADRSDNLPLLSIVGDDALTTAVVAANLGAVAARQVRDVLVIDTDVERQSLSSVTRVRGTPGLLDVLAGRVEWAAAVRSVVVDRDRTLDVLPSGAFGAHEGLDSMITDVVQLLEHVGRRYDCVLLSAPLSSGGGLSLTATLGSPVLVVRRARTPVRSLVGLTGLIRDRGCRIRGVLMWCRGEPIAVSA
jgi:Mrp family chromosome partitioning ATPase